MLAHLYEHGIGTDRDIKRAIQLYLRSAKLGGSAEAKFILAGFCSSGTYVAQSPPEKAFVFYREAADTGMAEAQYKVGLHYLFGHMGGDKDIGKAFDYFYREHTKTTLLHKTGLHSFLQAVVGLRNQMKMPFTGIVKRQKTGTVKPCII